jgi:transposase
MDKFIYREYGRALRGTPVYGKVSGRKYKRVGVAAGQCCGNIIAPIMYDGAMDSRLFEHWFSEMLLPAVPKNGVIVMDNATFHRKKILRALAEQAGCSVIFLPPYSPDLNPIEHFWAWLKRHLRKILPSLASFDEALFACFKVR